MQPYGGKTLIAFPFSLGQTPGLAWVEFDDDCVLFNWLPARCWDLMPTSCGRQRRKMVATAKSRERERTNLVRVAAAAVVEAF